MIDTTTAGVSAACLALSGVFDNHLWRILLLVARHNIAWGTFSGGFLDLVLYVAAAAGIWWMPHYANRKLHPRKGCVFVTGCDSGMGKATVVGLAKSSAKASADGGGVDGAYDQIFAGCFNAKSALAAYEEELSEDEMKFVTLVPLDVTDNESVTDAAQMVREWMYKKAAAATTTTTSLVGLVQFHGVAFNGPSAYMPVEMYARQLDVNFVGTIRVVQALLPLLKERESGGGSTQTRRIVLTGTGGGACSPCPSLLTAYMSSKFALEAYAQSLRQELFMVGAKIDVSVINPGFVKPTMLVAEGIRISAGMWEACAKKMGSSVAKDEYGGMMDHFTTYSSLQPGTHVSEVVRAAEAALRSPVPRSSYKVGIDSKLAPIVGMLPTGARELIARHGIYGKLSLAGTVPGYKV